MTSYAVHFYTDANWAYREIEADTPDQALALARQFADDAPDALDFQSYDSTGDIEHIEVMDLHGHSVAAWRSDDLNLRLAAPELLEALQCQTDAARAVIDIWTTGDLAGAVNALEGCLAAARDVLAQAKGGGA